MERNDILAQLDEFARHYDYDVSYQKELLAASPGAFAAFAAAPAMSGYRQGLPLDAHYVARITTLREEDCGPCTQLNLKMAVEAGVSRDLLRTLLERPNEQPSELGDVYEYTREVVSGASVDVERASRLQTRFGKAAFAELAVIIAGSRLFPTLKRALLHGERCQLVGLEF